MKTYVIDLDSTIIDTSKSIINLHNKLNPNNQIDFIQNHDWLFYPMIKTKEELGELFKLFDHEDFYSSDTLVIMENAVKIINELSMQNKVVICSKHDNIRRNITLEWIYKTFPTVDVIFTDTFDKSIVGKVDIALDDKIEALSSINAKYRLLYGTYDWNKNESGLRVNCWLEFSQFVNNLVKVDRQ